MSGHADFFRTVAAAALARVDEVMAWLGLPDGKRQGREYLPLNPKRGDHTPGSFSINLDSGAWADFAGGDKGGDLVSLTAYLLNLKQGEAADRLADFLGIAKPTKHATAPAAGAGQGQASPATPTARKGGKTNDGETCVMPIPADAPSPPGVHPSRGRPSKSWLYRSPEGAPLFHVYRWEAASPEARKQFSPVSLRRSTDGVLRWRFKNPPSPLPLFNLPSLSQPGAAVFVEGEKACDAAAVLLPDRPVLTWPGGSQAVGKADYSPMRGRECWVWADADPAGEKAANDLIAALHAAGAGPIKHFDLGVFAATAAHDASGAAILNDGAPLAVGDDAADLLARGWTAAHLALILSNPNALIECAAPSPPAEAERAAVKPATARAKATTTPQAPASTEQAAADTAPPARGFQMTEKGLMYFEPEKPPRWVCSSLAVIAQVRDPNNAGWGLLVEFCDPDRTAHRITIPMALFRGDGAEVAGMLFDRGLRIAPRARQLLIDYLQSTRCDKRARVSIRTGWHQTASMDMAVYLLPDETFATGRAEEWIHVSETPSTFSERGTLPSWQKDVAALCRGNSRLMCAVSAMFAAPLLFLTGSDGGGVHFRSGSSDGKSTLLKVAASVCGDDKYMQTWRATDNALESTALCHCDAPLLLDEIGQMEGRSLGEAVYMLANGQAKSRAQRGGGLRERVSWRTLFISTGEDRFGDLMRKAGMTPKAGQEIRLAEIPADAGKGLGVFENLHGFVDGGALSKHLVEAARKQHGTAFPVFLQHLVKQQAEVAQSVRECQKKFAVRCLNGDAHGQVRRVADRFALIAAAGELATEFGITGWQPGEAMGALVACFKAWLQQRGTEGKLEDEQAVEQVREFLRRYGESAFADWDRPAHSDSHAPIRSDRAGYRQFNKEAEEVHYYIFHEVWVSRVCDGLNAADVGRLLLKLGYVERGKEADRPWTVRPSIPTEKRPRVVHILPKLFED